ncbi:hypothetical protein KC349_g75 [Hortaea werneckii]|nr:hypothetical protein KC349_g75 [Hortaea werneckii]
MILKLSRLMSPVFGSRCFPISRSIVSIATLVLPEPTRLTGVNLLLGYWNVDLFVSLERLLDSSLRQTHILIRHQVIALFEFQVVEVERFARLHVQLHWIYLLATSQLFQNRSVPCVDHIFLYSQSSVIILGNLSPPGNPDNLVPILDQLSDQFWVVILEQLHQIVFDLSQWLLLACRFISAGHYYFSLSGFF